MQHYCNALWSPQGKSIFIVAFWNPEVMNMIHPASHEKISIKRWREAATSWLSIVQEKETSRVICPGHNTNCFYVSPVSNCSAENEKRYEQEKGEFITQFMDESSPCRLLLSSNVASGRKISRQIEDLQAKLIDMKKENGDLQLIQVLLCTQDETLILQADKSVFSIVGSGRSETSASNFCDALISDFSLISNDCTISTVLLAKIVHHVAKEVTNYENHRITIYTRWIKRFKMRQIIEAAASRA